MTIARTETHKNDNTTQYTKAEWATQKDGLKWGWIGLQQMTGAWG